MGSHDKLFKAVFSEPANAVAHFERFLPAEITAALDLGCAQHVPGSFVDEALSERHTDLLYRIPWRREPGREGNEVLLFVIFEHQSTVDPMMAFRMAVYSVRVWDHWLQEHPDQKRLPPILPLVLYHGEQEWTAATELQELLDLEGLAPEAVDALRPYLPKLQIMVDEVGRFPDEMLPGQGVVRLTLLLFKHGRGSNVLEQLPQWEDEFRILVSLGEPGLRSLALLVEYLMTVNEHVTVDELTEFLTPMGDEAKEIAVTLGQQLIDKGRQEGEQVGLQKGRQEGRQEGRREALLQTARKALAKGMNPAEVAELTELSLEEVQKLAN
jgi:predicted transposase YdaD